MSIPSVTSPRTKAAPETRAATRPNASGSTQASPEVRSSERPIGVVENLKPVQGEISALAARVLNRMGRGLKEAPHGVELDFDLDKLNEAVRIFSQIDTNPADDDRFNGIRALFNISTLGGEPVPFDAIRALVTSLKQLSKFEEVDPQAIEAAYKTLFADDPGYETGTPGQLLVSSIAEVVNNKTKITKNLEPYMPQFRVLNDFLKAFRGV